MVDVGCPSNPKPIADADAYVYSVDYGARTVSRSRPRGAQRGAGGDGVVFEDAFTPTCMNAGVPDEDGNIASDNSCSSAGNNAGCAAGEFAMWDYRRQVAPARTGWVRLPLPACFGADQSWSFAQVSAQVAPAVREYLREHALVAVAVVEPAAVGLVNLPVIVHTTAAPDLGMRVTVPFAGELTASAGYVWEFGEGEPVAGVGVGYDGTSALRHPEHYLGHAYSSTGTKRITLTTTWTATFTVLGMQVPLDPIVLSDTATIPVRSARSVLVDGT